MNSIKAGAISVGYCFLLFFSIIYEDFEKNGLSTRKEGLNKIV
ncbi:MAG: hypothetical protein NTY70_05805 [Burkholderiales bacterium]|nr:hypothetical protein [Burkholderiales bacterium]